MFGERKIPAILFFLQAFAATVFAQTYEIPLERQREQQRKLVERDLNERKKNLEKVLEDTERFEPFRADKGRNPLTRAEKAAIERVIAPRGEDLEKYRSFLKNSGTGIFRLFPDRGCAGNGTVRADGACANIVPGTWFYSFRRKNYSNSLLFDIQFKDGQLVTDGFLAQGILTEIGEAELDDLTLGSKGAEFLVSFKPETAAGVIKNQYFQIGQGIDYGGFRYSRSVAAEVGKTYLLRVVAYRVQDGFLENLRQNESGATLAKFLKLDADKRADIIIAFRIIRQDEDENLTILWKELEQRRSPAVVFAEK